MKQAELPAKSGLSVWSCYDKTPARSTSSSSAVAAVTETSGEYDAVLIVVQLAVSEMTHRSGWLDNWNLERRGWMA